MVDGDRILFTLVVGRKGRDHFCALLILVQWANRLAAYLTARIGARQDEPVLVPLVMHLPRGTLLTSPQIYHVAVFLCAHIDGSYVWESRLYTRIRILGYSRYCFISPTRGSFGMDVSRV